LLAGEPVLDRLDHGQLLSRVCPGGLGVGRGQGGGLGVFEVVGLSRDRLRGRVVSSLLILASAEQAPRDGSAGGLVFAVVALGRVGSCFDQVASFDIESGHVVAAGAGHE